MAVACGLRVLVGRKQDNMTLTFGISRSEVDSIFRQFLQAVNDATELDIELPRTIEEWDKVRVGLQKSYY